MNAPSPTKNISKWMWLIAWLCLGALLVQYFNTKLANQYNPNQDLTQLSQGKSQSITLVQNRQAHYVVTGMINGQAMTFMLDTGATSTVIPAHLAQQLGLQQGYASWVSTANGNIEVYATMIKSLSLGPLTLYDLRAQINPYMKDDTILLGMNVLKQFKMVQQGNQLTLSFY
ncbi:retropepsin-like aspartic protease family protein [Motilimonas eburnea]|uniref:retropepsin-like aspartic protease family protein n=1 Tax=Motilimonas eburnea TaxID=1737488 RepID=UPI001E6265CE|nr:retropepsin-like aspartic protease [Motilimonas eburnea]MCE2572049.1 retroviral-like aspartic protease family protein [Motilimonas eburnea]